jgi:hypothetical protein
MFQLLQSLLNAVIVLLSNARVPLQLTDELRILFSKSTVNVRLVFVGGSILSPVELFWLAYLTLNAQKYLIIYWSIQFQLFNENQPQ